MPTEASRHADFSVVRYAQVWEDADVLLDALNIQPGDTCLSIASAGDNALAMLTRDPARVVAVDLSAAQLACLQLRVAAYRALRHDELLELIGSRSSSRREALYRRCRAELDEEAAAFWDARPQQIRAGIGGIGKFERYFALFRRWVLPLVHRRATVEALLAPRDPAERRRFYDTRWNNRRWRWLFAVFFSRRVMGRFGRDPAFFRYVEGSVADRIFQRAEHALAELDPAANPYLHWILTGTHDPAKALPCALRPEAFAVIRQRLDRLDIVHGSLEDAMGVMERRSIDRFNLSDVFEYMSAENAEALLRRCVEHGRPGGRLAYWNMLVPRSRPASMADQLRPLDGLATELHRQDKAFFYSRLVVEEIA
ncbi:MAG: DUF3419 family protein [Planctomycetes bacterium]|jgi:S-adenosylmethionine-diacylglycerol 3-amino-3-carboxypropyl transferase|nr:DUF3419 family protein [Planctomycetota bacterium]